MGLDGGTIISRSDVIRGQSWRVNQADSSSRSTRGGQIGDGYVAPREAASAEDLVVAKWSSCSLTGQALREPIAACHLGRLYNRESVLEFLLAKNDLFLDESSEWRYDNQKQFAEDFGHLKSAKSIFEVQLLREPLRNDDEAARSRDNLPWVCPITHVSPSLRHPFAALASCGHVFAKKALLEVTDPCCPSCGKAYAPNDVVPINGSLEEVKLLKERLQQYRKKRRRTVEAKAAEALESSGLPAKPPKLLKEQ
ncbi:hypothetical protein KFL_000320310 [Klebsormidium nitens]|uniref:Uncharacterized protein n=1 Tax=Klebsormidium nitens TaxID=105231 RepID=A0A1Y1HND2_KLENI|nr:hypothetical protein KFL_000320310 [Klebsormidium nitens]|eukprot:GAQ79533.1 hypothetical protein KFL_000320310 [Klebsormidium nitens]